MILMMEGRTDEAIAVFELALQTHPGDLRTQILYLRALISNHSEKAQQKAREMLAANPQHWEILFLNAQIAAADGNLEKALALCSRSVALNPRYAPSQRLLGSTLAMLNKPREAEPHLREAIALGDPQPEMLEETQPEAHYELARVLHALGNSEEERKEIQAYQQLRNVQVAKTQAGGKAEGADRAMKEGKTEIAVALYREAIAASPKEPLLYYKLAKALEKANDPGGEKTALAQAIELNPGFSDAQNQMGFLAAHQGDIEDAEKYFRAAVMASPSNVTAWINLAATLASEERWKDAQNALDHALAIEPDNASARELKIQLAADHPSQ